MRTFSSFLPIAAAVAFGLLGTQDTTTAQVKPQCAWFLGGGPAVPVALSDWTLAQSGCCSWHGGVCGCQMGTKVCCDGTYSPSCGC